MASPEKINIPQKPPMVMVDRLISAEDKEVVTSFLIREDNVFCSDGIFTEAGLIENMAQTAAAGIGAKPATGNEKPPLGFIGGIRRLKINALPEAGQEITTHIQVEYEVANASIVKGRVFLNESVLAECELKIFLL